MVKFIIWVIVAVAGYLFYVDGIQPYQKALSQTNSIYQSMGIKEGQQATDLNRGKVIEALKKQCDHGFTQASIYDFRCASNSLIPFID